MENITLGSQIWLVTFYALNDLSQAIINFENNAEKIIFMATQ